MSISVFIDGAAGTTGLEIAERLADRDEFHLIKLDDALRKDDSARTEAMNSADYVILCLPDDAARHAASMISNPDVRVIDASSAHRVSPDWCYGFPEVTGRDKVAGARLVSNPGCYPTGFIGLVAPLVRAGLIPSDWPYVCHAVSGYSGGGKSLIARFEDDADIAFRSYALNLGHKHVPEMQVRAGLLHAPMFAPAVVPAYRGMLVEVPLHVSVMPKSPAPDQLRDCLGEFYAGSAVVIVHDEPVSETLLRREMEPTDRLDLHVFAAEDNSQVRMVAVLDNLGKGASGAAVQNLNLMAGLPETAGLRI